MADKLRLRENNDFSDVTLACEDGKQMGAHKVILTASSPFFQNLLKKNKHTHPLIYMRGVKSEVLSAILDFLYIGETNICQENLESFLAIADELHLGGLTGSENNETMPKEPLQIGGKKGENQVKNGAQSTNPVKSPAHSETSANVIGNECSRFHFPIFFHQIPGRQPKLQNWYLKRI